MFEYFWKKVNTTGVERPSLPRRRKAPKRFETGIAPAEFHEALKIFFSIQYLKALDLVINSIQGFKVYRNLQDLLTRAATGKNTVWSMISSKPSMLGILIHFDLAANSNYFRLSLLLTRAPFHFWMLLAFVLPLHLQKRIFFQS